jgi:predicted small lipoprotein YifL
MNCAALSKPTVPLSPTRSFRKILLTGMMLICVMSVCACGKKPPHVDPPEDSDDTTFPIIYPDPSTNK